jgi:4-aminobutyrate aminotransferase-like enzyme
VTAARPTASKGIDGLLLSTTGLAPDVVALHPALVTSPPEADAAADLLRRTLEGL